MGNLLKCIAKSKKMWYIIIGKLSKGVDSMLKVEYNLLDRQTDRQTDGRIMQFAPFPYAV